MIENVLDDIAQIPKRASKKTPLSLLGLAMGLFVFWGASNAQAFVDCPTAGECAAQDAEMALPTITGPATCVQGETIAVTIAATFTNKGNNTRYAAGIFVNALGNVVSGQAGQCVAGGLPVATGEGSCGDLGGGDGTQESLSFTTTEIVCNGTPGQALSLETMGVWSNTSEPSPSTCPIRAPASKCSSQTVTTSIIVQAPNAVLSLTKTAASPTYTSADTSINYTFVLENKGNIPLTNLQLTDNLPIENLQL